MGSKQKHMKKSLGLLLVSVAVDVLTVDASSAVLISPNAAGPASTEVCYTVPKALEFPSLLQNEKSFQRSFAKELPNKVKDSPAVKWQVASPRHRRSFFVNGAGDLASVQQMTSESQTVEAGTRDLANVQQMASATQTVEAALSGQFVGLAAVSSQNAAHSSAMMFIGWFVIASSAVVLVLAVIRQYSSNTDDAEQADKGKEDAEATNALEHNEKNTRAEAIYTVSNLLVGPGVLALPFAFRLAGAGLGSLSVLLVTFSMGFTGSLLGWAFDCSKSELDRLGVPVDARNYASLSLLAFGPRGHVAVSTIFVLELWMVFETTLVLISWNMHIFLGLSKFSAIIWSSAIAFVSFYAPVKLMSYISLACVIAVFGSIVPLFWSGVSLPADGPPFEEFHAMARLEGLPTALGLTIFCFGGHPVLPSIYWHMRDTDQFSFACSTGFVSAGVFYLIVASVGYYFFGDFVHQAFTDNLSHDLHGKPIEGLEILGVATSASFAVGLQGKLPLFAEPVLRVLESKSGADGVFLSQALLRLAFTLVNMAVAILFRNALDVVCSLTGFAFIMTTSIIIPCLIYRELAADGLGKVQRQVLLVFAMVGGVMAVGGTWSAILHLGRPSVDRNAHFGMLVLPP